MDTPSFVAGVITGIVGLILIMAIFVPDPVAVAVATYVVTRKNVPTMLLPLAIILLLAGLGALTIALYVAFVGVSVAPWVWISLLVGVALFALWFFTRSRH